MSSRLLQEVKCPCGEEFEAELWSSVNVAQDPELKDELLAGQLNVANCPTCKTMVYAERFVLYHDPSAELMAFIYPAGYGEEEEKWRDKTREDFAAAQNLIESDQRLAYPPVTLFGMDTMVELLRKEQEAFDQAAIVESLAVPLDFQARRLTPSLARKWALPPVLPLAGPADDEQSLRFRRGLDRVVQANDRLTVYAELRKQLDSLDLAGLWKQ